MADAGQGGSGIVDGSTSGTQTTKGSQTATSAEATTTGVHGKTQRDDLAKQNSRLQQHAGVSAVSGGDGGGSRSGLPTSWSYPREGSSLLSGSLPRQSSNLGEYGVDRMGDASTQSFSSDRNSVAGGGSSAEAGGDEGASAPRQTEGAALAQQQRQGRDAPESDEQRKTKEHGHKRYEKQQQQSQPRSQQQPQSPNNASIKRTAPSSAEEAKLPPTAAGTGRRAAARHGSNPEDSCDRSDSPLPQSSASDVGSPRSSQPRGSTITLSPGNASSQTKTTPGEVTISATALDAEGVDPTSGGGTTEQHHSGTGVSSSESTLPAAGPRATSAVTAEVLPQLTDDSHSPGGSSSNDLSISGYCFSTRDGKKVSPIRHSGSGGDRSPQGGVSPRKAAATRSVNRSSSSSKPSGKDDGIARDNGHCDNDNNDEKEESVDGNAANGRPVLNRSSSGSRSKHKRRRRHDGGSGGHEGAGSRYRGDSPSRSTLEDPDVGTPGNVKVDQRGEPKRLAAASSSDGDGSGYGFTASGDGQNLQSRPDADGDDESHSSQHRDHSSPRGFASSPPSRPTGRDEGGTEIRQAEGRDVAPCSSSVSSVSSESSASISPPSSSHGGGSGGNSASGDRRTSNIR